MAKKSFRNCSALQTYEDIISAASTFLTVGSSKNLADLNLEFGYFYTALLHSFSYSRDFDFPAAAGVGWDKHAKVTQFYFNPILLGKIVMASEWPEGYSPDKKYENKDAEVLKELIEKHVKGQAEQAKRAAQETDSEEKKPEDEAGYVDSVYKNYNKITRLRYRLIDCALRFNVHAVNSIEEIDYTEALATYDTLESTTREVHQVQPPLDEFFVFDAKEETFYSLDKASSSLILLDTPGDLDKVLALRDNYLYHTGYLARALFVIIHELEHVANKHTYNNPYVKIPPGKESFFTEKKHEVSVSDEGEIEVVAQEEEVEDPYKTKKFMYYQNIAEDLAINYSVWKHNFCRDQNHGKALKSNNYIPKLGFYPELLQLSDNLTAQAYFEELLKDQNLSNYISECMKDFGTIVMDMNGEEMSDREKSDAEFDVKQRIMKAVRKTLEHKGRGFVPGNYEEYVELFSSKQIPWKHYLHNITAKILSRTKQRTHKKRNRRHMQLETDLGMILYKGAKKQRTIPSVHFTFDTSGSVSSERLGQCLSEVLNGLKSFKIERFVLLQVDAGLAEKKMYDFYKFRKMAKAGKFKAKGRGGTSFIPAMQDLENDPSVDIHFYFTDGYGDWDQCTKFKVARKTVFVVFDSDLVAPEPFKTIHLK